MMPMGRSGASVVAPGLGTSAIMEVLSSTGQWPVDSHKAWKLASCSSHGSGNRKSSLGPHPSAPRVFGLRTSAGSSVGPGR